VRFLPLFVLLALLAPSAAAARTPKCEALPEEKRALADELLSKLHPYDCCDDTLAACLAAPAPCPLATRLADDVCRMVAAGKGGPEIEAALGRRARSMLPLGAPASIAVDPAATVGDPAAPVVMTVYACTRCPFCKIVVPALHREVTKGALKGKARLAFRPFPIRDHAGSTEGGLALLAAARQGKFWPYLLDLYARFDAFDAAKLGERAAALGLSREAFETAMADPALREQLVEAKREGVRNKVTATPTVFLGGRRYHYDLDPEVLVDVLLEEYERVTAR
jgi:protein-disulfide isomerase